MRPEFGYGFRLVIVRQAVGPLISGDSRKNELGAKAFCQETHGGGTPGWPPGWQPYPGFLQPFFPDFGMFHLTGCQAAINIRQFRFRLDFSQRIIQRCSVNFFLPVLAISGYFSGGVIIRLSDLEIVELYRNLFLQSDIWAGVLTINRMHLEPYL